MFAFDVSVVTLGENDAKDLQDFNERYFSTICPHRKGGGDRKSPQNSKTEPGGSSPRAKPLTQHSSILLPCRPQTAKGGIKGEASMSQLVADRNCVGLGRYQDAFKRKYNRPLFFQRD